jgi:energy-coupling factor transporter ATP-binding protein EcfA2
MTVLSPERFDREDDETRLLARFSTQAPRIPWDVFHRDIFRWKQGEHIGLIGPTGQGKTTLMLNLMPLHPYTVAFATKPADETMDALVNSGWVKMEAWRSLNPKQFPRRVLWPDARDLDSEARQQAVFLDAFRRIYREGAWTVAIDEDWYIENVLRLSRPVRTYLLQARSLKISLVIAAQRPAWIAREAYSSATHLFFWRNNDRTDLERLSGIGWLNADLIKRLVASLEAHQFLYVNTRTGIMCRSRCPEVRLGNRRGG